ncbi:MULTISPECIES: YaeQ family protein [Aliiglaciecola]|uniref:YaeQ family protein n=1 Tax=Aliiglaciecola TaxID=1406885 RepID=UPI001C09E6DC|nr:MULTISPECIES: YaeQ family protein [Aliiglaciecola]MBU2878462.1 YaeQ family protein [Aliiglaciecola lipolytica]MDO6713318.1 YaeQ family protein [Aliiglaciecola sp. 2_MG-2023]MDO6754508.1 YaeQ family protein [Aliiglaciecola sp. 1_MG-2023]
MALKPTIYKFRISLADMDRHHYDNLSLIVAQHPSETTQRMMARIVAFCIHAQDGLELTKGLSETAEPDIWVKQPNDDISLWIEIGEPDAERIKKATRLASNVIVYSFNTKSDVWWQQSATKFKQLNAKFYRFDWQHICQLTELIERTMDMTVTIADQSAFIATNLGECEVPWDELQAG